MAKSLQVVILQHPQESKESLGSAKICKAVLPNLELKVGLSWGSLKSILKSKDVNYKEWMVLYLGKKSAKFETSDPLVLVNKNDSVRDDSRDALQKIRGLVLIDGTWAQAKTMWWRNSWLLKLQRGVLIPDQASLYGKYRKAPRKECLSTLEALGRCYTILTGDSKTEELLLTKFKNHLNSLHSPKESGI